MKRSGWLGVAAIAFGLCGCRIGEGEGSVTGSVSIKRCLGTGEDRTDLVAPSFNLDPQFYAAEPIDDPVRVDPVDQLRIRVQHSGAQVENVDALIVDVADVDQVTAQLGQQIPVYAAGATHPASGTEPVSPVRMTLSMLHTCAGGEKDRIAVGVVYADGDTAKGRTAWIRFTALGRNFGDRITADFEVDLVDLRPEYLSPEYGSLATGHISGSFDFIMRRGRSAQAFP